MKFTVIQAYKDAHNRGKTYLFERFKIEQVS